MNKIIKAGLVASSMVGEVALNAWYCMDCQRDHQLRICIATGKTYGQQALDMDPTAFPLVGHVNDVPVHGPINGIYYKTPDKKMVQRLAGQWLYCTVWSDVFVGKADEVFGMDGHPLPQVGALADGCTVYQLSNKPTFIATIKSPSNGTEGCVDIVPLSVIIHKDRFVYFRHCYAYSKHEFFLSPEANGAYFDGCVWINKKTDKVYKRETQLPRNWTILLEDF
ncbi:MAG: hypothetical protein LBE99_03865 [Puniceicoccales bacterium]|jgi:hypothetical protein|nr:hypothetical protein [Puniceicoccales bacterium]